MIKIYNLSSFPIMFRFYMDTIILKIFSVFNERI